jgi:DNA polymerase-3 subunit epsilon/oligoribonuclease
MLAIFLDTETNGLNPFKHTLLEIAYQIVDLQTGTVHKSFSSFIRPSLQQWEASDPASLKINGLTWEIVQEGLLLSEVRNQVIDQFLSAKIPPSIVPFSPN